MYSKSFLNKVNPDSHTGFLVIELLIGLLIVSIGALGVGMLLIQSRAFEQQADWGYRATLSASNCLESQWLSNEPSITEWQVWLSETFPNSKIIFEGTEEKITIKCLAPPDSKLKTIEMGFQ